MKPNFFGLNIPHIADFPPAVPLDSYRFWDDGCQRIWINEAEGEFVTTQLDAWVAKLTAAGVKDVIFCLGGTPQWISSQPTNTSCDYGAPGFWGYCAPPRDINPGGAGTDMAALQWYKFIGQYAATHPELLFHWEPWNEFTRQSQSLGTHSWLGTNQQLVRLCEDARAVILGRGKITATGQSVGEVLESVRLIKPAYARPESVFLSPSYGLNPATLAMWQEYLRTPGALEAAEALAIHPYLDNAENLKAQLVQFLAGNADDIVKPIWATEGSWGKSTPPADPVAYVSDYYAAIYPLVDRFYWYAYAGPNGFWDGIKLTPAGEAYVTFYNAHREAKP